MLEYRIPSAAYVWFGALTISFSPLSSGVIGKGFGSAAKLTAETKLKDKVAIRMRSPFKVSVYSL
ncbi:hypothetical protein VCRA2133E348_40019 [Vibrio crassostreae]|nr:hypothetical protein VCRA2133E348_40019 [Vibrio crassostreae]CAK3246196.1 hypothetical protein VCRA213O314_10173 [Vibrio crassostreae]